MIQEFWVAFVGSDEVWILNHHFNHGLVFFHVAGVDGLNRYLWQSEKRCELVLIRVEVVILIEFTWSFFVKRYYSFLNDELGYGACFIFINIFFQENFFV